MPTMRRGVLVMVLAMAAFAQSDRPGQMTGNAAQHGGNPWSGAGVEQQLALREVWYKDAALSADGQRIEKLLADGYVGTGPDGVVTDKPHVVQQWKSGALHYDALQISRMQVRAYRNVGVVSGRVQLTAKDGDHDISGTYQYTRVWLKQPHGDWQVIAFSATPAAP